MQYIINKTFFLASKYNQLELTKQILKFFSQYNKAPFFFRIYVLSLQKQIIFPQPVLQCLISHRSKFVLSRFNLARLSLKENISDTYIMGTRKSS